MKWVAIAILMFLFATPLLLVARDREAARGERPVVHKVVIDKMKFVPATLTIRPGEVVVWVNNDVRDHTVDAADGSFSSGNIGPGARFTQDFRKAGKYPYACSLHPRMRGVVVAAK